jgi:hypothetical protein
MLDSLPALKKGEAWFVPDSDWLHGGDDAVPFRFRFRWRETFDSTQVRRIGVDVVEPKVLADIDLDKIREVLEETPEPEDQSEEIAQLRGQVHELEEKLAQQSEAPTKWILDEGDRKSLEVATAAFEDVSRTLAGLPRQIESLLRHYANGESRLVSMQEKFDEATTLQSRFDVVLTETPSEIVRESPGKPGQIRTSSNGATSGLSKAERLILTVLAQYPRGSTAVQIAILTGYAVNGGGFRNALGSLNTNLRYRLRKDSPNLA